MKAKIITELSEAQWVLAEKRYHIIKPLLNRDTAQSLATVSSQSGYSRATLYRWMKKYKASKVISALTNEVNRGGKGKHRLPVVVEAIVLTVLENQYLTRQRPSISHITREINRRTREAGLTAPHYSTIRARIHALSQEEQLRGRYDPKLAKNKCQPMKGGFPDAGFPLAAVQIDHTTLDIVIVDELSRKPVGRPWMTVAIDVFSRMIIGFYISLDPPGALGTGLCISHAILPKDSWLSQMDIGEAWPCHGLMKSLYLDNAREFHGKMLERGCLEYGIEINFRPVATPNYGGHIERLLGTVLKEIHQLPGTTFSSIQQRRYYDAEGKACFTLKELERWLSLFVVQIYHNRLHQALNTTPLAKYRDGVSGTDEQIGTGALLTIENERKLKLDFLPFVERSVQRYGIVIDFIAYYHDVLRKWVTAHTPSAGKGRRLQKFVVKRDPRDISAVYFYDPELQDYFCIPYRNTAYPPISIWEHRHILRLLKAKGLTEVNEELIFETYREMRAIQEKAVQTTHSIQRRRNSTRKELGIKRSIKNEFHVTDQREEEGGLYGHAILPFEDIQDGTFD